MAWRRPGNKPLSEPRMISLPTHICVTRPQWVKHEWFGLPMQANANQPWLPGPVHFSMAFSNFRVPSVSFHTTSTFSPFILISMQSTPGATQLQLSGLIPDKMAIVLTQPRQNRTSEYWSQLGLLTWELYTYRQTSNTRRTQSQNLNVFHLVLQLS